MKKVRGRQGSKLVDVFEDGVLVDTLPCILNVWTGQWPHYVDQGDEMKRRTPDCVAYVEQLKAKGRAVLYPAIWKDGTLKRERRPIAFFAVRNVAFTEKGLELDVDPSSRSDVR
jgi:hypothetical protein